MTTDQDPRPAYPETVQELGALSGLKVPAINNLRVQALYRFKVLEKWSEREILQMLIWTISRTDLSRGARGEVYGKCPKCRAKVEVSDTGSIKGHSDSKGHLCAGSGASPFEDALELAGLKLSPRSSAPKQRRKKYFGKGSKKSKGKDHFNRGIYVTGRAHSVSGGLPGLGRR